MEYAIWFLVGAVISGLFVAYRLRGDRTVTQAVLETIKLAGPSTKPPAR